MPPCVDRRSSKSPSTEPTNPRKHPVHGDSPPSPPSEASIRHPFQTATLFCRSPQHLLKLPRIPPSQPHSTMLQSTCACKTRPQINRHPCCLCRHTISQSPSFLPSQPLSRTSHKHHPFTHVPPPSTFHFSFNAHLLHHPSISIIHSRIKYPTSSSLTLLLSCTK